MSSSRCSLLIALAALLALTSCDRSQRWTFRNAPSLGDVPPPQILAEIYDGTCGPCAPEGARMYCELLSGRRPGTRPDGLEDGHTYCFVGTALDDTGAAYAVGCDNASIGAGQAIDVTLAPIEADRVIARRCAPDIMRTDAGAPVDAGPRMDAGIIPVGVDAGPPLPDAGPRMDAGLTFGDPITVRFIPQGPGAVFLSEVPSGNPIGQPQPIREGRIRTLNAYVGFRMQFDAQPDTDAVYVGIGGGCGAQDPCAVILDRSEDIYIRFAPATPPM